MAETEAQKEKLDMQTLRRSNFLDHDRTHRQTNREEDMGISQRWKASMQHQLAAHKHDLQFELATQKIRALKLRHDNNEHAADEEIGIDLFEKNLRRAGLGGGDGDVPDNNEVLTVTYEDGTLYWQRLDDIVDQKGPSDTDVGDFLSQLKGRTKEKRTARYEKARRRRRMLVDQGQLALKTSSRVDSASADAYGTLELTAADLAATASAKAARNEEIRQHALEKQAAIVVAGEQAVIEFCDRIKVSCDVVAREQQRLDVLKAREEHKAEKRIAHSHMCREICLSIVTRAMELAENDVPDGNANSNTTLNNGGSMSTLNSAKPPVKKAPSISDFKPPDPIFLATELARILEEKLHAASASVPVVPSLSLTAVSSGVSFTSGGPTIIGANLPPAASSSSLTSTHNAIGGDQLTMKDIHALDSWPAFVNLANNVGKWEFTILPDPALIESPTFLGSSTLLAIDQDPAVALSNGLRMPSVNYRPVATRPESFLEVSRRVLERIIHLATTGANVADMVQPDSPYANLLMLNSEELYTLHSSLANYSSFNVTPTALPAPAPLTHASSSNIVQLSPSRPAPLSLTTQIVVVTAAADTKSHMPPVETWQLVCAWLGGPSVARLWDIEDGIKVGLSLGVLVTAAAEQAAVVVVDPKSKDKNAPPPVTTAPVITYPALIHSVFSHEAISPAIRCPEALASIPVPDSIIKLINDIAEACNRIQYMQDAVAVVMGRNHALLDAARVAGSLTPRDQVASAFNDIPFVFNELTVTAVIGQSLCLRAHLREKILACFNVHEQDPFCPVISPLILASYGKFSGLSEPMDNRIPVSDFAQFPKVLAHFAKGGFRDNFPAGLSDVGVLVQAEAGLTAKHNANLAAIAAAKAGPAPTGKGAKAAPAPAPAKPVKVTSTEAPVECKVNIAGVFFISHKQIVDNPLRRPSLQGMLSSASTDDKEKRRPSLTGASVTPAASHSAVPELKLPEEIPPAVLSNPSSSILQGYFSAQASGHHAAPLNLDSLREFCKPTIVPPAASTGKQDAAAQALAAALAALPPPQPLPLFHLQTVKHTAGGHTNIAHSASGDALATKSAAHNIAVNGDGAPDDLLVCENGVLFAEHCVACVFNMLKPCTITAPVDPPISSPSAAGVTITAPTPTTDPVNYEGIRHSTVREFIAKRRANLPSDVQMVLAHFNGQHTLNLFHTLLVLEKVCFALAMENQLFALLLFSQGSYFQAIERRVRQRDASLATLLKTEDSRWQHLCKQALECVGRKLAAYVEFSQESKLHPIVANASVKALSTGAAFTASNSGKPAKLQLPLINQKDPNRPLGNTLTPGQTRGTNPNSQTLFAPTLGTTSRVESAEEHQLRMEEQMTQDLRDLVCQLGDVIDERHMQWIDHSNFCFMETDSDFAKLLDHNLHLLSNLGRACTQIMEAKLDAMESISHMLNQAHYGSGIPWSTKTVGRGNINRISIERRRNMLKSSISCQVELILSKGKDSVAPVDAAELANCSAVSNFGPFLSVELPTAAKQPLISQTIAELYVEQLCTVTAMVRATDENMKYIKRDINNYKLKSDEFIKRRHAYEHRMLSAWSLELNGRHVVGKDAKLGPEAMLVASTAKPSPAAMPMVSPASIGESSSLVGSIQRVLNRDGLEEAVNFLSSYHFGVSDEVHHDGVAWTIGGPAPVESRDMKMPIRVLVTLVTEVFGRGTAAGGEMVRRSSFEGGNRRFDASRPAVDGQKGEFDLAPVAAAGGPADLLIRAASTGQTPLSTNRSASAEMEFVPSTVEELTADQTRADAVVNACASVLTDACNSLHSRGVPVPGGWKRIGRIRDFIVGVKLSAGNQASIRCLLTRVFLTLLYSVLPVAPTMAYIIALLRVLGEAVYSPTSTGEDRVHLNKSDLKLSVEDLLRKIASDKMCSTGWYSGADETTTRMALHIFALCSLNDKNLVVIPHFLLAMCKAPRFLTCPFWEKQLLARPVLGYDNFNMATTLPNQSSQSPSTSQGGLATPNKKQGRRQNNSGQQSRRPSSNRAVAAETHPNACAATAADIAVQQYNSALTHEQRLALMSFLPALLQDGSYKALIVASQLQLTDAPKYPEPGPGSAFAHLKGFQLTPGASSLHELKGKRLELQQVHWLLSMVAHSECGFASSRSSGSLAVNRLVDKVWTREIARPIVGNAIIHKPHLNRIALMVKQVVGHALVAHHPSAAPTSTGGSTPGPSGSTGPIQPPSDGSPTHGPFSPPQHGSSLGPNKSMQKLGKRSASGSSNPNSLRRGSFGAEAKQAAAAAAAAAPAANKPHEAVDYAASVDLHSDGMYAVDASSSLFAYLLLDANAFVVDKSF